MRIIAKTHVGLVRDKNQDSLSYGENLLGTYLIIADGMGGHNCGEYASSLAVSLMEKKIKNSDIVQLKTSVEQVNEEMFTFSENNPQYKGMGTTMTVGLIANGILNLCHVGDSRAYVFRKNDLCQLTTDHSYVQELLDSGQISQEEADKHPQKNMLTQALGTAPKIVTQTISQKLKPMDKILMCTDGLTNLLTNDEISAVLRDYSSKKAVDVLIELTLQKGAPDNITVLVCELEGVN